jgi:hypothetical protein
VAGNDTDTDTVHIRQHTTTTVQPATRLDDVVTLHA